MDKKPKEMLGFFITLNDDGKTINLNLHGPLGKLSDYTLNIQMADSLIKVLTVKHDELKKMICG